VSIGYACIALGLPGSKMRGCTLKNASPENLDRLTGINLFNLSRLLDYNIKRRISLFRISSDVIPFGSHPVNRNPWWATHAEALEVLGSKIKLAGMRVSMHPGQYTVLNSPDQDIVARAVDDLEYHTRFLDTLGLSSQHKVILHVGGHYGDHGEAAARFMNNYAELPEGIRRRLVIENDEKFDIAQVIELARMLQMPVVFDVFHHSCRPPRDTRSVWEWIDLCQSTWNDADGVQKIHYSQQEAGLRAGAHSSTIRLESFLEFYRELPYRPLDIMLEVKDKDLSAIKCILAVDPDPPRRMLEEEWARYKYLVMEHSHIHYQTIGKTLNPQLPLDGRAFYLQVEEALAKIPSKGQAWNAAQHVWGYFKDIASDREKKSWQEKSQLYQQDQVGPWQIKEFLKRLAIKYERSYLLDSYYFLLD